MAVDKSSNQKNHRWVIILTVFAVLLAALPIVFAIYEADKQGMVWRGSTIAAPSDIGVYLNYIDQAADGKILFDNVYHTGPQQPALNIIWLVIGWISNLLKVTPLFALHLTRLLLIPILAFVSWRLIKTLVPPKFGQQIIAFSLVMFGGGIGTFLLPVYRLLKITSDPMAWPIDTWIPEAFPFFSSAYSPHFLAAWILFIIAVSQLLKAINSEKTKPAIYGGIATAALLAFHPFHLATILIIGTAYLVVRLREKKAKKKLLVPIAVFLAIIAPLTIFRIYGTLFGADSEYLAKTYSDLSPNFWHILAGMGLLMPLAIMGYLSAKQLGWSEKNRQMLAIWAIVQTLAFYGPFFFQRRLLLGWLFPLALLSTPGLIFLGKKILNKIGNKPINKAILILVAMVCLFSIVPGTFMNTHWYQQQKNDPERRSFIDASEYEAVTWVKDNTPSEAVFISTYPSGYSIGGWAGRHVYLGHWANSGKVLDKAKTVIKFFSTMSPEERSSLIKTNNITHIWHGPREKKIGQMPLAGIRAELIYNKDNIDIYHIIY